MFGPIQAKSLTRVALASLPATDSSIAVPEHKRVVPKHSFVSQGIRPRREGPSLSVGDVDAT
jgi:hypothetical protein